MDMWFHVGSEDNQNWQYYFAIRIYYSQKKLQFNVVSKICWFYLLFKKISILKLSPDEILTAQLLQKIDPWSFLIQYVRGWRNRARGRGAVWAHAPPQEFATSVKLISTTGEGGKLCHPHYYSPLQIFRLIEILFVAYSNVPNKRTCTFISGKVCLLLALSLH